MSQRFLNTESQRRIQSKSKTSLDDFDRHTIQSKIMINLGTNPFMDTIQSPSCSSLQEYLSQNEDTATQKQTETIKQYIQQNTVKQYQGSTYLKPPPVSFKNNSQSRPAVPFQKKNLKNLLNKSEKQANNSEYDFAMQDSITDENPNIEIKVMELNNNQACNFTKFEQFKKKNERQQQYTTQASNCNITAIKKVPYTSQETGQNTQTTQVFLNSPTMHTGEKINTPNSILSHQDDVKEISQNNPIPFYLDGKFTSLSDQETLHNQKNNFASVGIDNSLNGQCQDQQIYNQTKNFNTISVIEQNKLNQQFNGGNWPSNQPNTNSNQFSQMINQSQVQQQTLHYQPNFQPQIQINLLTSQQQINTQNQTMNSPSPSKQLNQYQIKNNQYEDFYQNLSMNKSPSNYLDKQQNQYAMNHSQQVKQQQNNQEQLFDSFSIGQVQGNEHLQSPLKLIGNNGFNSEGGLLNYNSPINIQSNNISSFNNSLMLLQSNNGIISKQLLTPNQFPASSHMLQSQIQVGQNNLSLSNVNHPLNNQAYYNTNFAQQRSQSNGNINGQLQQDQFNQKPKEQTQNYQKSFEEYQLKNSFIKNPPFLIQQQVNCTKLQNDSRINSISYSQLNQMKTSEKSAINSNCNIQNGELLSSNNLKETINLVPGTFQEQINLQQYTKDIIATSNKIRVTSPLAKRQGIQEIKGQIEQKNNYDNNLIYQTSSSSLSGNQTNLNNTNSNNMNQLQNGINLYSVQKKVNREKENPITRLRNKSQPIAQRSPVHQFTSNVPQIPPKMKEETPTNKNSMNFKNMVSSLLYHEEDQVKKTGNKNQLSPQKEKIDQLHSSSNSLNANPILGDNNPLNSLTTNMSIHLTNSIPIVQSIPASQVKEKNNIAYVRSNINNFYSQITTNQPINNLNHSSAIVNGTTPNKFSNNLSQPKVINQGKGESMKERFSPFKVDSLRDSNKRSQSCQKDANISFLDKSQNKINTKNQKINPTPTKQRIQSQHIPQYRALQNNYISQSNLQQQNNSNMKQPQNNENRNYSKVITEKKFQQPESPIKSVEPYSPFNTNRNSQSFQYDLNSFKNVQSSLNTVQQQQQFHQIEQKQQNSQPQNQKMLQENMQIPSSQQSTNKIQVLQQLPLSQIDKNSQMQYKQPANLNEYYLSQNNQRQQNYQTLLNTTKILNDQSINTKKITSQQLDKKGKVASTSDQNSQKKELPKNAITVMRIHQKSNSISGIQGFVYGNTKISSNVSQVK